MKFGGVPNQRVRIKQTKQRINHRFPKVIKFDKRGIYETESELMIKLLKERFPIVPNPVYKCKKCDFETENKGLLLAHYKVEHPTGGRRNEWRKQETD